MSEHESNVDRFRARIAFVLTLKHTVMPAACWAFLWGTLVVVLRAAMGIDNDVLLWGVGVLLLCPVVGFLAARRRLPSRSAVRSLLDRHNQYGGLLMASGEVEVGQWEHAVRVPQLPSVRWQGDRAWSILMLGAIFLAGSFFVPKHFANAEETPFNVEDRVKRIGDQVQVLKEERILDPERAEEMKKKLQQVQEDSKGTDPVKTLEAIDRAEEVVKQKAKETAEKDGKKTEELARTEALADVLRKKKKPAEGGLSDKQRGEAMKELARLTREAMKENPDLLSDAEQAVLDQLMEGDLSPETLEKLSRSLKESKTGIKKRMQKLVKARLIDPEKLKDLDKCGECDGEELLAYLKKCEGKCSVKEAMKGRPGQGGVDRGPGAADLGYTGETKETKADLKEHALPEASLKNLKDSKKEGTSIGAPQISKPGGETTSGALNEATAGGGSAQTQVILPRHRAAVERYFERSKPK